jgi:hypothetical protein
VAFTSKVGGKNLEKFIGKLPFAHKWHFSDLLNLQESMHLLLVFYGLLFVVIEGYQEIGLHDPEVDALLANENVALMKRCRNYVFHFQAELGSDKLMNFLEAPGTEIWSQQIFKALGKFLFKQSEQFFADKNY